MADSHLREKKVKMARDTDVAASKPQTKARNEVDMPWRLMGTRTTRNKSSDREIECLYENVFRSFVDPFVIV
jgi:hypothetical protein